MTLSVHPDSAFPAFDPPKDGLPFYMRYFRAVPAQYALNAPGFNLLRDDVVWERRVEARSEAFMSDPIRDYTYGKGENARTYTSVPFHQQVRVWMTSVHACSQNLRPALPHSYVCTGFNACFLNRYDDEHQALGWHSDDSPGQDHDHPIAVFTTGQAREIWVRPIGSGRHHPARVALPARTREPVHHARRVPADAPAPDPEGRPEDGDAH